MTEKPKLTDKDEYCARELADRIGVNIISIDLSDGTIIAIGEPEKVKEYQELWEEMFDMGIQCAGGM